LSSVANDPDVNRPTSVLNRSTGVLDL
jgi:hypothetical protein